MSEIITPEVWAANAGKVVPLVFYDSLGERHPIGECKVTEDGKINVVSGGHPLLSDDDQQQFSIGMSTDTKRLIEAVPLMNPIYREV